MPPSSGLCATGRAYSPAPRTRQGESCPRGPEVRRLACTLRPSLVVLDTQLDEESGWLTCDKLISEKPQLRVVLVEADPQPESAAFATFVGATALIDQEDPMDLLVEELVGA